MDKIELFFRMMEHPQRYSAHEWHEMLADDEVLGLYNLMSETKDAMAAMQVERQLTDKNIDSEWKQFEKKHLRWNFPLQKIAAMFIGFMAVSGIAIAAVHIARNMNKNIPVKENAVEHTKNTSSPASIQVVDTVKLQDTVLYENVPLEEMLPEMAVHYGYQVEFRNEAVRRLRLFYKWNPTESMEQIVEKLNHFEAVQLRIADQVLIVE